MQITQIRNATIIVNYNNTKFLIDPWLGPKEYMPGFEGAVNFQDRQPRIDLPFDIKDIINVDAVIITHIHPDHWDIYASNAIDKKIKIFVQSQEDKNYLTKSGFLNIEILTFEGVEFNNIRLYKTPCEHGKREIIEPVCKKLGMPYDAMGIIFKNANEPTLYIAGDTIWNNDIKNTIQNFTPEIIVINACGASILSGEKLIMNIDDISEVLKNTPNTTKIIASHMDAVSHLTVKRKDIQEFINNNKIENLLLPENGKTLTFDTRNQIK